MRKVCHVVQAAYAWLVVVNDLDKRFLQALTAVLGYPFGKATKEFVGMPDEEVIYTYLRGLDPNVAIALCARDALRVLPGITFSRDMGGSPAKGIRGQGQFDRIALPTFRALLIALVMLKRGPDGFEGLANSSATSIKEVFEAIEIERIGSRGPPSLHESAAPLCAAETVLAARQDGNSIEHAIESLRFSQNLFVRRFKTELKPGEFAKMTMNDVIDLESWEIEEQNKYPDYDMRLAKLTTDHVTSQPPWATGDVRDGLNDEALYSIRLHLDTHPNKWRFWKRWHDGILHGTPLNWDVQHAVASLPDDDWAKGPEWIAGKIAEIENQLDENEKSGDVRQPEFEPADVDHVLRNPTLFAAQSTMIADQVTATIEAFHRETGLNQLPEAFGALVSISVSCSSVSAILRAEGHSAQTETALREEIGRLNARIAELESALEIAKRSPEPIFTSAFKAAAGKSLGDWKMYAGIVGFASALTGSLWVLSGDEIGPERRLNMLQSYYETIFGPADAVESVEQLTKSDPTIEI